MFYGQSLLNLCKDSQEVFNKMIGKSQAQRANIQLLMSLFNYYSNIGVTRYDWHNLPSTVNERFLNESLYFFGQACFFADEQLGYLALPCTQAGEYNMYYEPTRVNAFSFNINRMLTYEEFVLIRNNPTCTPTATFVMQYISRMADVLRTIDVLCKKMKQPFIILCDEKERLTWINILKSIDDNEMLILGTKNYDLKSSSIDIKDTRIEADLTKLWEVYRNYENMLLTAMGINNKDTDKRERLLQDEVNANNMLVDMSAEVTIKELQAACERINDKYGLDISVSAKGVDDYLRGYSQPLSEYDNPTGGEKDG